MTPIRYDIAFENGGWRIACNETMGPPYNRKGEATRDALWIANLLRKSGDEVDVYLLDHGDRTPRLLPMDGDQQG